MKLLTVPSLSPMHRRLPKLNGMKASGIVIFPSPSKNLSGLKVSGSLQYCSPIRNQTVKLSIFKKQVFIYSSFYFCRFLYVLKVDKIEKMDKMDKMNERKKEKLKVQSSQNKKSQKITRI